MGIYGRAAARIERRGWVQYAFYTDEGICLTQAIFNECQTLNERYEATARLGDWLLEQGEAISLIAFNDRPGQTKDYLLRVLRKADEEIES